LIAPRAESEPVGAVPPTLDAYGNRGTVVVGATSVVVVVVVVVEVELDETFAAPGDVVPHAASVPNAANASARRKTGGQPVLRAIDQRSRRSDAFARVVPNSTTSELRFASSRTSSSEATK
jgi:hypothetical protein